VNKAIRTLLQSLPSLMLLVQATGQMTAPVDKQLVTYDSSSRAVLITVPVSGSSAGQTADINSAAAHYILRRGNRFDANISSRVETGKELGAFTYLIDISNGAKSLQRIDVWYIISPSATAVLGRVTPDGWFHSDKAYASSPDTASPIYLDSPGYYYRWSVRPPPEGRPIVPGTSTEFKIESDMSPGFLRFLLQNLSDVPKGTQTIDGVVYKEVGGFSPELSDLPSSIEKLVQPYLRLSNLGIAEWALGPRYSADTPCRIILADLDGDIETLIENNQVSRQSRLILEVKNLLAMMKNGQEPPDVTANLSAPQNQTERQLISILSGCRNRTRPWSP